MSPLLHTSYGGTVRGPVVARTVANINEPDRITINTRKRPSSCDSSISFDLYDNCGSPVVGVDNLRGFSLVLMPV